MYNINENDIYIINPNYNIRSDIFRAVITNSKEFDTFSIDDDINHGFIEILNPITALLFTYFDGTCNFRDTIKALSEDFKNTENYLKTYINQFVENQEEILNTFEDFPPSYIPKRFIIKKEEGCLPREFDTASLVIDKKIWDLKTTRLYIPESIMFMVTNRCLTDCIYCYADKSHKLDKYISIERVKEIMNEASSIGVTDFALNGGDIFVYKYWKELLKECVRLGFNSHVSTKYPLTAEDINYLKEIGVKIIQISYDSDDIEVQQTQLKVGKDYRAKMLNTFTLLEEAGIKVNIKSVITRFNSRISDIKKLLDRLASYKNINLVSIAPAEASLYKHFDDYKPERIDLDIIRLYIQKVQNSYPSLIINCQGYTGEEDYFMPFNEKVESYKHRAQCTANISGLLVLPDGKVSICEELYWHPNFILGDLNEQSIMEVWNSDKAKNLNNIEQNSFPAHSVCAKCTSFDECRKEKGVCWKLMFHAYGIGNIHNPDPRCPFAPPPENIFYQKNL